MKEIKLTQGYTALVDDEDYALVSAHKWCAEVKRYKDGSVRDVYAVHYTPKINGKRKVLRLHSFLMGTKGVDHIDLNGLNNQRYNLRLATTAQNNRHQRLRKDNASGYKGVYWDKWANKWKAQIGVKGKQIHLGLFVDILDAALVHDVKCLELHGEFALTNAMLGLLPKEGK